MDIAAVSTNMQQSGLAQAVNLRLLSMAKEQAQQNGQQLVQMMERSVSPNVGANIDIRL